MLRQCRHACLVGLSLTAPLFARQPPGWTELPRLAQARVADSPKPTPAPTPSPAPQAVDVKPAEPAPPNAPVAAAPVEAPAPVAVEAPVTNAPIESQAVPAPNVPGLEDADDKGVSITIEDIYGKRTLLEWRAKKDGDDEEPAVRYGSNGKFKDETIVTDRPDFTEASTTVGKGVVQVESGYTYIRNDDNGVRTRTHSFPEALVRVGVFADWLELRMANNYLNERTNDGGAVSTARGWSDMYLGMKMALYEQDGILPEVAIMPQMLVPLNTSVSDNTVLPGCNLLYGWDVIEDKLSCGGSSQINRRRDGLAEDYAEFAQSFTIGYGLGDKLSAYTEWFVFCPLDSDDADTRTQHYFDGGLTYLLTDNVQLDIRAGVGASKASDDFFLGAGLSFRF